MTRIPPSRFIIPGVALVLILGWVAFNRSKTAAPLNGDRIIAGIEQYRAALRERNEPVPMSVPLSELVDRGFLLPEDTRAFSGMTVVFYPGALDSSTNDAAPGIVLARAELRNGEVLLLLPDGSVQSAAPNPK